MLWMVSFLRGIEHHVRRKPIEIGIVGDEVFQKIAVIAVFFSLDLVMI
jgi:hypothetical protein